MSSVDSRRQHYFRVFVDANADSNAAMSKRSLSRGAARACSPSLGLAIWKTYVWESCDYRAPSTGGDSPCFASVSCSVDALFDSDAVGETLFLDVIFEMTLKILSCEAARAREGRARAWARLAF
jgi:hypothetical protein